MLIGAHTIIYSKDPAADRAFSRDVLGLPHVDVGEGWLIFSLPPSELAFHPDGDGFGNGSHEFYFMCEDIQAFVAAMGAAGIACTAVKALDWGQLTRITLPGGGKLGVYQPRHARPTA